MKICLLAKGPSAHTQKWAEYLSEVGNEVCVLSFLPADIKGVKVIYLPPPKLPFKLGYLFLTNKVKKLLEEIKPDIVHAHFASSYGFLGALSGFHPFVISVWGSDIFDFPNKSILHKKLLIYTLGKADIITATSKMLAHETKIFCSNKNMEVIPFGVDTKVFYPGKKSNMITIICTKAFEKIYGHGYLIRAFKTVTQRFPTVKLVLVGEGSLEDELRRLVEDLGIKDKVDFLGHLEPQKLSQVLRESHIFVIPSLRETFGVSALEASASGVAVLASDIPGLKETVIEGKTGLFFEKGNVEKLAKNLLFLIENQKLRSELAKNGREFVISKYSGENNAEDMLKIYGKLKS